MGEDETGTLAALMALRREIFKPKELQYHGRTVKLMGDGIIVEFGSVTSNPPRSVLMVCRPAAQAPDGPPAAHALL
jgi:class 3 adenylate cyclase